MMLQNTVRELIELIDEISDIYTAHWVGLRERHCLWEVLPIQSVSVLHPEMTYIASCSSSPVGSQHTPDTWSNSS
jgi:hypothetical protein